MKVDFKKVLLAGTALVAVNAFATQADAAALTLSSSSTWASGALHNSTPATDVINALTSDSVTITGGVTMTITNNGTANDNGGLNTFATGALTTGGGAPSLAVTTGSANDLTVTIASGALGGAVSVTNRDADNAAVNFTSTGALTVGTTLTVTNAETSVAKTVAFNAGNTIGVTGATTLTGGNFAGANTTLTATGNATLTGAVAVNAGTAGNATLTLNGAGAQSFGSSLTVAGGTTGTAAATMAGTTGGVTGAVAVTAGSGGSAALTMNGSGAQTLGSTLAITGGSGAGGTAATTFGGNGLTVTGAATVTAGAAGTATLNLNTTGTSTFTGGLALTNGSTAHAALNVTSATAQTLAGNITGNGDIKLANSNAGGVTLSGTVAAGTITLDAGAGTGSNATFKNTVTSTGGIVLGNAAGTATNVLTLDSTTQSFTATGAISGAVAGQTDNLAIIGGANTVTLANDVGANIDNITLAAGTTLNSKSLTATGNVTFTGTGVVNGSVTAGGATTIATTGALTLNGTTGTIGAITSGVNNTGNLTIGNGSTASTYTLGGALAANGTRLGNVTVSNLATANISNSIFANNVALSGTENFTGAANIAVTSTVATTVNGTLNTAITGGNTLALNSDGNSIIIGGTGATTISAGNQIGLNSTSITFGANTTNLLINKTAAFDPDATAVLNASIAGGTAVKFVTGSVLRVTMAPGSLNLINGDTITVIDGNAAVQLNGGATNYAALLTSGNVVLANTGLVRFVDNTSTAQDLLITANFINPAAVLSTQANVAAATSLQNNTAATGNLLTARQNLLNAPTAAAANLVAESLAPPSDNASVTAALDVTDSIFSMSSLRLADMRNGNETGMAAGNYSQGHRVWGQAFGRTSDQDRRSGTAGYQADTGGVAFGMDGETGSGSHVGIAVSYADTGIDSDNANRTETNIDSYQLSLYGDIPLEEHLFLNGMAAYVFNQNETTRHNVGGIAGVNANGEFDANQFVAQVELGRDFKQSGGLTLTPSVMANYSYYDADGYTETGAGTANLRVSGDSVSALNLGVGVDAVWDIDNHDGSKLQPSLNAGYRYDVIGDSLDNNASFTGGGAAFTAQGVDPARSTFTAGAGLKYYTTANWELSARYTFDAKEDYTAHAGQLRAAYKF